MNLIPSILLKQLYTHGSLRNIENGVALRIKNRLKDADLVSIRRIRIDAQSFEPEQILIDMLDGSPRIKASDIREKIPFPLRKQIELIVPAQPLAEGMHQIVVEFKASPFGNLTIKTDDAIKKDIDEQKKIPRDPNDDYAETAIKARQLFIENFSGKKLQHIVHYSFDPHITQGNCEHFVGVAQVPIGIAGPLRINGEHAQGEFLIPLATSEGTLVASYNRGMKVLNLSGGVTCTIIGDAMQRAPVFIFENAREARQFAQWVQANFEKIAREAEATSSIAKLKEIDTYLSNKFTFMRFNYHTGDAAGQNMVGRATFAACGWILDNYEPGKIKQFYLESNFATDKKASQVNVMRTRGKRVVAECTVKRDILQQIMRVDTEKLFYHYNVANIGSILSGANNNGLHSANGITAMFIATGQDVANVSESSAGVLYCELTPNKDLYMSITIPSLIVATYGGGTGLATQRECLEILGCYGKDKVKKFAEIVAGVVLAGEISLASAISTFDWISSHEEYGRNR